MSQDNKPVTRLCALDRLFEATGEVAVQCGKRTITLPIQAVDLELVESICRQYKPKPKVRSELVKGVRHVVTDTTGEEYQEALVEFNRTNSYAYVLCALGCDVVDKEDKVVWSADNSVHDLEAARKALKAMGIVDNQLVIILNAASNLTKVADEERVGE
jgi:hypothetical protein